MELIAFILSGVSRQLTLICCISSSSSSFSVCFFIFLFYFAVSLQGLGDHDSLQLPNTYSSSQRFSLDQNSCPPSRHLFTYACQVGRPLLSSIFSHCILLPREISPKLQSLFMIMSIMIFLLQFSLKLLRYLFPTPMGCSISFCSSLIDSLYFYGLYSLCGLVKSETYIGIFEMAYGTGRFKAVPNQIILLQNYIAVTSGFLFKSWEHLQQEYLYHIPKSQSFLCF